MVVQMGDEYLSADWILTVILCRSSGGHAALRKNTGAVRKNSFALRKTKKAPPMAGPRSVVFMQLCDFSLLGGGHRNHGHIGLTIDGALVAPRIQVVEHRMDAVGFKTHSSSLVE